jgi:quinol monooxygenase YgiN
MVTLVVRLHVHDYDAWKPVFDEAEGLRRKHGATGHRIYRDLRDRGRVVVHEGFPSEDAAQGFAQDPQLREAMARGGVEGEPAFSLVEQVEDKQYAGA